VQPVLLACVICLPLQGLWNPALLASGVENIQANDLFLGGGSGRSSNSSGGGKGGSGSSGGRAGGSGSSNGPQPGLLLLTGANTGGKSTLLRASCLAAVMAQASCGSRLLPCLPLALAAALAWSQGGP